MNFGQAPVHTCFLHHLELGGSISLRLCVFSCVALYRRAHHFLSLVSSASLHLPYLSLCRILAVYKDTHLRMMTLGSQDRHDHEWIIFVILVD